MTAQTKKMNAYYVMNVKIACVFVIAILIERIQMNDFTKEELKKLYSLIRFDSIEHSSEIKENLKNKLQSMVENYCDECNNSGKIDNMCDGRSGCCVYLCSNCKESRNE